MSTKDNERRVFEDDEAFFTRHPEREYRLRRVADCEVTGQAPPGFAGFKILHRYEVGQDWNQHIFGARITFETKRTDAEIREILAALAADRFAMILNPL